MQCLVGIPRATVSRVKINYKQFPTGNFVAKARTMHIRSIPMWTGKRDNYSYLVSDPKTKEAVIIDPANPPEVLPVLKEEIEKNGLKLKAIINTHHHGDHAGGNEELLKHYSVPIIGGKDCDRVTQTPSHNSVFNVCGDTIKVTALHTPCHTQDSISFFFDDPSTNERALFCGDTLFIGGCGRFFEGTAEEMDKALNWILGKLPDDTKVFPGHEYTKGNAKFAVTVTQDDAVKSLLAFAESNKETQGKFTIGDEKKHNVFMRIHDPSIQAAIGTSDALQTMQKLRELKNAM